MRSSASLPSRPERTASASATSASATRSESRQREQAAPAALDVQRGLIGDEHDVGAGDARRARVARRARLGRLALGPGQRGAVGLGGVGGGDDERALACAGAGRGGPAGAQALDGAGERELGAAHALDEVAAAADAERLELGEGVVEQGEAAADALGEHLLAGDDPVALEQQLGERTAALERA